MALNLTGMVRARIRWRVELERKRCGSVRENQRRMVEYVQAADKSDVRQMIEAMSHLAAFRITRIREER